MSQQTGAVERKAHDESVSMTVVAAVADATGVASTDLNPLFTSIDPDALDRLFEGPPGAPQRSTVTVQFTLDGCAVEVSGGQTVTVTATPPEDHRFERRN